MKKVTLIIFLLFIYQLCLCQGNKLKFNIIDSLTGKPLSLYVSIHLIKNDTTFIIDDRTNVLSIAPKILDDTLEISYTENWWSYHKKIGIHFSNNNLLQEITVYFTCPSFEACPKCHKTKFSIPISYGSKYSIPLRAEDGEEVKAKGNTSIQDLTVMDGGCVMGYCSPNYYCKNDNISYNLSAEKFINNYIQEYKKGYDSLHIPDFTYDYVSYFKNIPDLEKLKKQDVFFNQQLNTLITSEPKFNTYYSNNETVFDHLNYEIKFNIERILLETDWVKHGRIIPVDGLYKLKNRKKWYQHFSQKFTSLKLSPKEIIDYGKKVVKISRHQIDSIRVKMGFTNNIEFYAFLNTDTFFYHSNTDVVNAFNKLDNALSKKTKELFGNFELIPFDILEWPNSDSLTAPGMLITNSESNKNTFYYNFYNQSFNKQMIDWLYLHEVMPGHNLQYSFLNQLNKDSLQNMCFYPGNLEGWACYIESIGKYLGAYNNDYTYLGKCEWDLIRSARIVIDYGIHYKGWSKKKALNYWMKHVKGKDKIALREINRVINWPGQSLSYQIGANFITTLKTDFFTKNYSLKPTNQNFYNCFFDFGMRPLEIIKIDFEKKYREIHSNLK